MKAARFHGKHKLIVEDVPVKEPGPKEVLIKIHYCGVCGTDVHIYEGDKGSAEVNPPVILGHEFSGIVIKTGEKVSKVITGDKVSVDPNDYCGNCYFCANGHKHLCENMVGLGTAADGGFAEYITVPENLVFKIPEEVDDISAAMTEPLSCCLHGMDLLKIEPGNHVMVIGTGNIGLIMVQLAKNMGAATVIAVEPSDARRELAISYGADIAINPVTDDTEKVLTDKGVKNVEKVIDCAGLVNTAEYAVKYAGRGATVLLFGLTGPDDLMQLNPFNVFQKELTIKGSFVNPNTFERSIRMLQAGIIKVKPIVTDIVGLDNIQDVFEQKLYKKNGKVLIKCAE